MGVLGVLAAPLAFEISRVLHKGALQALIVSGPAPSSSAEASPVLLALVKGVEYGCLGLLIAWIESRQEGLLAHIGAGLAVGLMFGGLILAMTIAAVPQLPGVELATRAVNEVLFPVGCSLVLFSADTLGKRISVQMHDAS